MDHEPYLVSYHIVMVGGAIIYEGEDVKVASATHTKALHSLAIVDVQWLTQKRAVPVGELPRLTDWGDPLRTTPII